MESQQDTGRSHHSWLIQSVNDRVFDVLLEIESEDGEFLCECSNLNCIETIQLTLTGRPLTMGRDSPSRPISDSDQGSSRHADCARGRPCGARHQARAARRRRGLGGEPRAASSPRSARPVERERWSHSRPWRGCAPSSCYLLERAGRGCLSRAAGHKRPPPSRVIVGEGAAASRGIAPIASRTERITSALAITS